jgi:recombination protein RecA
MAARKKKSEDGDDLATLIQGGLSKDGFKSYFLDGEESSPTDLVDFISTGCTRLDVAISNRKNGGIACGRITELTGLEQSGKSLMAAHMMADAQLSGGVAVLLDTEAAVNAEFFAAIGINMKKMVYVPVGTVEQIFEKIEEIIEMVRRGSADARKKKVIIVVDSVAAAPTIKELEGDYSKEGYGTDKAIIISRAMRKITNLIAEERIALVFTNQLRHKMNAPAFSDPYTTSGGKAIGFHASTRLRLEKIGMIKTEDKEVIGVNVRAKVVKNRLGPPHRVVDFDVYFDRGIDDTTSMLKYLKAEEIVKGAGAWYEYVDNSGEEHKFQSKDWAKMLKESEELRGEIYDKMCESMIMSYSSGDLTTEDASVIVEEGVDDE